MQETLERLADPEGFIFDPSLVLYLPLYELDGASFMSKDAYGHLCTVTGAVQRPNSRKFDGSDDNIIIPRHSSIEPAKISLLVWAYIESSPTNATQHVIDKAYTSHVDPYYTYIIQLTEVDTASPDLKAIFTVGGFTSADEVILIDISASLDTWVLIAATFDETNMYLNLNGGARTATVANAGSLSYVATDLYIAEATNPAGRNFQGNLGEVWIYNRALTPLEIQHNYLATK